MIATVNGATLYTPTSDDVLWLSRAVEAEGPPRLRVAQTLVNGFMFARAKRGYARPLADYVRAYAQPVNPRWYERGDLYQKSIGRPEWSEEQRARLREMARRREFLHSTRTQFSLATLEAVDGALKSGPDLPNATDYAAHDVERKPPWQPLTDARPGQNRFWVRPGAQSWDGYVASVERVALQAAPWVLLGLFVWFMARGSR